MKKNRNVLSLTVSCIATLTLAGSALGQELTSGNSSLQSKETPTEEGTLRVTPGFMHFVESDLTHEPGKLSISRYNVKADYALKSEDAEFGLGGLYEYSDYHISADAGGNADKDVNRLDFNAHYKGMVDDNWGYLIYGSGDMAASTDADLSDGLMGTAAVAGLYKCSDTFNVGLGVIYSTSLEDDNRILPLLIVNWQINDRWALHVFDDLKVTFDATGDKKLMLDARLYYQIQEYRIEGAGNSKQSVIESMGILEIGATYRFAENIAVRGFVGMATSREYKVYDNGHRVGSTNSGEVDSGAMVGVNAIFTF